MEAVRKKDHYDVILIGSGISSLVCGALLARKKLRVLILERHNKPGGFITSYKRKNFHFDVPHVISNVDSKAFKRILAVLDLRDKLSFNKIDNWQKWIYPDMEVKASGGVSGLIEELSGCFPKEKQGLRELFAAMGRIREESRRANRALFLKKKFPALFFPTVSAYTQKSFQTFLESFIKDERLKAVVSTPWVYLGVPPRELSTNTMCNLFFAYLEGGAWYPEYGYQNLSNTFAEKILEYGGVIRYNTPAEKIFVNNNKVYGVYDKNGKQFKAKFVISGIDSKKTFLNLVGEKYLTDDWLKKVSSCKMSSSGFSVHIGTRMDLTQYDLKYGTIVYNQDYSYTYYYDILKNGDFDANNNIQIGISVASLLSDKINEKGFHSLDIITSYPNYYYWENALNSGGKGRYGDLKEKYADLLIKTADKIIPGLSRNIIVKDIATPLTYNRYTDATEGAWFDAAQTVNQSGPNRFSLKSPIKNLLLIGAKLQSGGFMPCALSGFSAAQFILRGKALK